MKSYKNLSAYDADGDLTKTWFVSYYFIDPNTGKYKRFRETGNVNRIHDVKQRKQELNMLLAARKHLLERGYSPFERFDNEDVLEKVGILKHVAGDCIDKVLKHKELHLAKTSFISFKNRINSFKSYLSSRDLLSADVNDITKRHIIEFLDSRTFVDKISGRTRNNLLIDIKSLFSCMIDMELLKDNPAIKIKKVNQTSEKNQYYQKEELNELFEWLELNDPYLLLFCKFIYFTLIRPIELTRLQVKDIDLKNMVVNIPAHKSKTRRSQSILIMEVFKDEILKMNLQEYPPDYYVFSAKKVPHSVPTTRDYFTDKFKNAKLALGLSSNHTMYSLKHTAISNLLMNGAPESDIRKYSRHTSSAFEAYTKYYEMQKPRDLSEFLK